MLLKVMFLFKVKIEINKKFEFVIKNSTEEHKNGQGIT